MSVEVVIANPDPHARLLFAIIAECNAAQNSLFAKRSVVVVHEQQTRSGIASNINVWPAVFVQISSHHSHAVALFGLRDACLQADIGKRTVPSVFVE